MRLEQLFSGPTSVTLWGPRGAVQIQHPAPGVLRVRHAPSASDSTFTHPRLPAKQSFAVVGHGGHALTARRNGDTVHVSADGVALALSMESGTWTFHDSEGRLLASSRSVAGEPTPDYPVVRYRSRLALHAPEDEAYLGFGEKVGPLDKRGLRFTFWNTDVMPHHPDTDPLYTSIPFFIGLRQGVAWGLFLDESWRSEVDVALTDPQTIHWESHGPELDCYLIAGPAPADVVKRYVALTGRPPLPPLWSLGAQQSRWGYENEADIRGVIQGYRERDLPLDCVYLDIDYQDGYKVFTFDRARFPDPKGLARDAAQMGVKLVPLVGPAVRAEPGYSVYEQAREKDYVVRFDRGEVLMGEVWPTTVVFPDFSREEVQRWWGSQLQSFSETGIAGIWNDMNEPACFTVRNDPDSFTVQGRRPNGSGRVEGPTLPYDARHGTRRHLEVHNVYALGMGKAVWEGLKQAAPDKRPFILTRAGFAGIQRYAAMWTGDNSSHWTQLESSIPMLLGLGLSGVAFTGVDIPGFVGRANGELLVRWMQAGMFYPLMRNHSAKGTPRKEPWRFGEPYLTLARETLRRRYRLLPALYSLMQEATETGLPVMRPLSMHAPAEGDALRAYDQFLFGPDLLVAPIVRPGHSRRLAYLPAGKWLSFPNLDRPGQVHDGGGYVIAEGPLDTVPVWLRAGGAVPFTQPALHTTDANWKALTWHIHAAAQVTGRLYEDEGEGHGDFRLTRLSGGLDGDTFRLERRAEGTLPLAREGEVIRIHGLAAAKSVTGARSHRAVDGALELEVGAGWDRIEVRL